METQKRYWLFGCKYYYPNGGMDDFRSSFDTLKEDKIAGERFCEEEGGGFGFRDFHIYDTVERKVVRMDDPT